MALSPAALLANLNTIQERNIIPKSDQLFDEKNAYPFPNFSVEMETGTGKTYVYLRSIFELNRKFGFKNFIIVVPSVAIREGVLASVALMMSHFAGLFDKVPYDHFVYNSKDLSKVRQFAVSNEIQIMVINIQAFQKDAGDIEDYSKLTDEQRKKLNIIHQEQDKMSGRRPIEFVQATKPIVIIDEPQSVDTTVKAHRAIKTLNPLLILRYSATHANPYNLLYKLDPIRAYDMRLVKQIEVSSIRTGDNFNETFIRLDSIGYAGKAKTPHARITIHEDTKTGPKDKKVTLKQGTAIAEQTNRRGYDGYIVTNICAEEGLEHVEFANGTTLQLGETAGGMGEETLKMQSFQAVEEHFKKVRRFKEKGIKVLSLFFVDRVANYRSYDDEGNRRNGIFADWLEKAYREFSQKDMYWNLIPFDADKVHDGYFSEDRKKGKVVGWKDTKGTTKEDDDTYHKIMRDKERLLSAEEPLSFIFSHSALREGWDNPNVFQICTLREMGTDRERRQTLGRGLRLPVSADGNRVFDHSINRLTVIANESFEDYAKGLQTDIEKDLGEGFKFGRIANIAFARVLDPQTDEPIGQDRSKGVWKTLVDGGYLDKKGDITDKFMPEKPGFVMEVAPELEPMRSALVDEMKRYIFKNRIVNARDRRRLNYNKRVELSDDFKTLWEKINKKTRYRVEFATEDLIERATEKIKKMEKIHPVQILIDKTEVNLTEAGVEGGKVLESKANYAREVLFLPDILAFLQRETELTRGTLVEILKQSARLAEFKVNPQAFMTEVSKLITRTMNELLIDGIKYEKLEGQSYEMRLFEEKEIEEYLTRLYTVQSTDNRTPYDFVPFDSEVERDVAEKLDSSEAVRFFCKLPNWFKIPTPLGDYNPDWAVVLERDEKIYLVRETKDTHARDSENKKIDCGQAHFDALGVDYKVAINIQEVLTPKRKS